MKINKNEVKDCKLSVEIEIDKKAFEEARINAYVGNTDRYPVMGTAPGMATLEELSMTYGPAVLFDEALELIIPETFNKYLKDNDVRIMGRPQVDDMKFTPEGGVVFNVKADMFPNVELGQYKGIAVPFRRSEQQYEFEQAVIQKACENMKGEIPPHMIVQKLDAITAQQKINVNNDAVYHLFADMMVILDEAYKITGAVSRRFRLGVRLWILCCRQRRTTMRQTGKSFSEIR